MKNNIDLVKIDSGNLGVVNFNNMIPVSQKNYELIDLNAELKDIYELKCLNKNIKNIQNKTVNLYEK